MQAKKNTRDLYCERMANGLTFVRDRLSGLSCCIETETGIYRHGDLRLSAAECREIVGK